MSGTPGLGPGSWGGECRLRLDPHEAALARGADAGARGDWPGPRALASNPIGRFDGSAWPGFPLGFAP